MLIGWFVLDRAVSTVALIALISILAFILWFPVQMPRNLPILSSGFVVYFAAKTALWLIRNYLSLSEYNTETVGIVMNSVLPLCMVYWLFFLTPAGATEEVRTGHSWRLEEQARLMGQLESMNAMLLRSARR
jgi:riboflavin transporter FmnP